MKQKNRSRGAARKAAKESGNFTAAWRPRPATFRDRKKEASKKACRGTLKEILNQMPESPFTGNFQTTLEINSEIEKFFF